MQQEYILKKEFNHLYDEEFHGLKGTIEIFQSLNIPIAHIIEDVRIEMKLEGTNIINIKLKVALENNCRFVDDFVEKYQLYDIVKKNLEEREKKFGAKPRTLEDQIKSIPLPKIPTK